MTLRWTLDDVPPKLRGVAMEHKPKVKRTLPKSPDTFPAFCLASGLFPCVCEYRFHAVRKWRFDYAWPDKKVALEIEGGVWKRGGGRHTRGTGYIADMEKYNAANIAGWCVIRVVTEEKMSGKTIKLLTEAFSR